MGAQRVPHVHRLHADPVRADGRLGEGMTLHWEQVHPAINALLNLSCFVFLVLGRVAIARGDRALHKRRMLTAFTLSSIFLVSYLIRFATTGAHKYPGDGIDRIIYLVMLLSHMVLAV